MATARSILLVAGAGLLRDVVSEVLIGAGHELEHRGDPSAVGWSAPEHRLAVLAVDDVADPIPALARLGSHGASTLAVTEQSGVAVVRELILGGATSVFTLDGSPAMLLAAVELTAEGTSVLGHPSASFILAEWRRSAGAQRGGATDRPADLTARELDVLTAMAAGLATKAVARRLGVSLKTVESHKANLFKKLGVRTQAQAVAVALQAGWVEDPVVTVFDP